MFLQVDGDDVEVSSIANTDEEHHENSQDHSASVERETVAEYNDQEKQNVPGIEDL